MMFRKKPDYFLLFLFLLFAGGLSGGLYAEHSGRTGIKRIQEEAQEAVRGGKYIEALRKYGEILRENPSDYLSLSGMAEIYYMQRVYLRALYYADKALIGSPDFQKTLLLKARILTGLRRFPEALKIYDKILKNEPNDIEALIGYGTLKLYAGRWGDALDAFKKINKLEPANPRAVYGIILLAFAQNDETSAKKYLEEVYRYNSVDERFLLLSGEYKSFTGQYEAALEDFEKVLVLNPDRLQEISRLKAEIYMYQRKYDKVIDTLERYIQSSGDLSDFIWTFLGTAYLFTGEVSKSLQIYKRVLERNDTALNRLFVETLILRKLPLQDENRIPYSRYRIKQAQEFKRRYNLGRALETARRAVQLAPFLPEARRIYADILKLSGYPLQSIRQLEAVENPDKNILRELSLLKHVYRKELKTDRMLSQAIRKKPVKFIIYDDPVRKSRERLNPFESDNLVLFLESELLQHRYLSVPLKEEREHFTSFEKLIDYTERQGLDYLIVTKFYGSPSTKDIYSQFSVYDVSSREVIGRAEIYIPDKERIIESLHTLSRQILEYLPVYGQVLHRGSDYILNLGRFDGIEKNSRFQLFKKSPSQSVAEFLYNSFHHTVTSNVKEALKTKPSKKKNQKGKKTEQTSTEKKKKPEGIGLSDLGENFSFLDSEEIKKDLKNTFFDEAFLMKNKDPEENFLSLNVRNIPIVRKQLYYRLVEYLNSFH